MCEFEDIGDIPYLRVGNELVGFSAQQIEDISKSTGADAAQYVRDIMAGMSKKQRASLKGVKFAELPEAASRYLQSKGSTGGED